MKMNADAYADYLGKRRSRLITIGDVTKTHAEWANPGTWLQDLMDRRQREESLRRASGGKKKKGAQ